MNSVSCIKHGLHLGIQGLENYPTLLVQSQFSPHGYGHLPRNCFEVHVGPKHVSAFPYDYIT